MCAVEKNKIMYYVMSWLGSVSLCGVYVCLEGRGGGPSMVYHGNKVATVAVYAIFHLVGNCVKFHT